VKDGGVAAMKRLATYLVGLALIVAVSCGDSSEPAGTVGTASPQLWPSVFH
jgi:hypothetical protein